MRTLQLEPLPPHQLSSQIPEMSQEDKIRMNLNCALSVVKLAVHDCQMLEELPSMQMKVPDKLPKFSENCRQTRRNNFGGNFILCSWRQCAPSSAQCVKPSDYQS